MSAARARTHAEDATNAGPRMPIPPFGEFLEANRAAVYRFLTVAVGPADADDCFQETFLSALRAYPRLTDGSRLDRWVLTIASRKAIDHHRARGRRAMPVDEVPEPHGIVRAASSVEPTDPLDPLWVAVRALPPRQRVAVVLRHVLDRPYDEIAELMGCSEATARANVYQGTKRLRELIA